MRSARRAFLQKARPVILLDTNALLWLEVGHRRAAPLRRLGGRLHVSPASILEIEFLIEAGRLRLKRGASLADLARDPRWILDEPPSGAWFEAALDLSWTRDPFDRLIAAHARLRGWRLATADEDLVEHLGAAATIEL